MANTCQICHKPCYSKYCPDCRTDAYKVNIRDSRAEKRLREKENPTPSRKKRISSDPLSGMTFAEINVEARKREMSYGQYVAAISAGTMKRIVGINKT